MTNEKIDILIGNTPLRRKNSTPAGEYVQLLGETYYRIANVDKMPPFFMSLVSSANHWLFIGSNGGLTAGRINAEFALFPYETEDKVVANNERTGSKTILLVNRSSHTKLWEPFSNRYAGVYHIERHLYKNIPGNKLVFEEINHDLELTLRYAWRTSDEFGFVRSSWLHNTGGTCDISLLDGLQNILPYGATTTLQTTMSSLLNAYKRNELDSTSGIGIFALSSTLTDRAEPSESLMATIAWQIGLDATGYLLSSEQIDMFRSGRSLTAEKNIYGKPGSYLVHAKFSLEEEQVKHWHIVADVNQDSSAVTKRRLQLQKDPTTIECALEADITLGTVILVRYVAAADGLQLSAQKSTATHHFANVLFNIMRGGIFASDYQISTEDFLDFVSVRNQPCLEIYADWFAALPSHLNIRELYDQASKSGVPDLIRLSYEYLPLSFSRRHGDPSRPWNSFSINLKQPDGSLQLDYQGNWRDIFQNWEPLAYSFPDFIEGMISKFLNATTPDGYNPYRITRNGIEWEVPEPDNPWSNIGYWSDHQIIYLQKLLEIAEHVHPGKLMALWNQPIFAYANVPYRLRTYSETLANWDETIDYDWDSDRAIEMAVEKMGTDGRLLLDKAGMVVHGTMTEKLLVLLLAKLTNLVPEGGIWMNTQRPEWNDANNALVGKGLSVVTVAYLRRFITFWLEILSNADERDFAVNETLLTLFNAVQATLTTYQPHLQIGFTDLARRSIMDELGKAITDYRSHVYRDGITTNQKSLSNNTLLDFLTIAQQYIEQTLAANFRPDGMAHTYNILKLKETGVGLEHLYLMLEGQVAMLSSGYLEPKQALALLENMRQSDLYRPDQHSYMLYPNRALPGFLEKNAVAAERVASSALVQALISSGDRRLLVRDEAGVFHFNGRFRNVDDLNLVLDTLAKEPQYAEFVTTDRSDILALFEATFNHRAYTGRSGTIFAFEGLGSIYWHMVSKLLLAAQESYQQAIDQGAGSVITDGLAQAYNDILIGIGFNKSPEVYGAFPTDPYSHTPMGGGASQPGMTGQVKEEILTRWGELGVRLQKGYLYFSPTLLEKDEFLQVESTFDYVNINGDTNTISLMPDSLAFTYCQIPIIYQLGDKAQIEVHYENNHSNSFTGSRLDKATTQQILNRDGQIKKMTVTVLI